jgi:hypothetical protein
MVITGIVTPLATIPSISKLYFTHSQHASGQSLTTWSIFALYSKSIVARVWLAQSKGRHLRGQHHRADHESADGKWHPHACRVDLLSVRSCHERSWPAGMEIPGFTWKSIRPDMAPEFLIFARSAIPSLSVSERPTQARAGAVVAARETGWGFIVPVAVEGNVPR